MKYYNRDNRTGKKQNEDKERRIRRNWFTKDREQIQRRLWPKQQEHETRQPDATKW